MTVPVAHRTGVRSVRSWSRTSMTALVYALLLGVAELALNTRSAAVSAAWMSWASTDLVNLREHPVRCLVVSAFLTDDHPLAWVALALIGLVSAGWALGNLRAALLVTVAHVLATGVSEGLVAYRISVGLRPESERTVVDVGPSYVVISALAVGIAYGSWPARIASSIAFVVLVPYLFGGLWSGDEWALGHVTAVVVGLGLGWVLHRSWRRDQERVRG